MVKRGKKPKRVLSWEVSDTRARKLFPEDGFLRRYLEYIETANDSPLFYHLGSIMTVMSALAGFRDIKVVRPDKRIKRIPLQMWSALIGMSGDRKSAAIDPAIRIARLADSARVMSTEATSGAWHQELADPKVQGVGVIHYDELSTFFDTRKKTYNAGLSSWLRTAWSGGPITKRTATEPGEEQLKYPPIARCRLNILGAIPPDTLSRTTDREDWRTGLLPRFTFWGAERKGYMPTDGFVEGEEHKFAEWMSEVCADTADIVIKPGVSEVITNWCYEEVELCRSEHGDDAQAILQRFRDKGFVFASLFALSDLEVAARTRLRVQAHHAQLACCLLKTMKRSMLNLFSLIGATTEVKEEDEVLLYVIKHPWCTREEIVPAVGLSRRRVTSILQYLDLEDQIERDQRKKKKGPGRPAWRYRATP